MSALFFSFNEGPEGAPFEGNLPPRPDRSSEPASRHEPLRGETSDPHAKSPRPDLPLAANGARKTGDEEVPPPERSNERGKVIPIARLEGTSGGDPKLTARLEQLSFSSKSEAVCGILLEKYVPGFKLVPGETFQVPVGPKRVDFKVHDTFVEFHPVQLRYEFTSQDAYRRFQEALGRLSCWERDGLNRLMRQEFAGQYAKGRRNILNCFDSTRSCDLIVCTNEREFIEQVVRRFGKNTPSVSKLLDEFNTLYGEIKRGFRYP